MDKSEFIKQLNIGDKELNYFDINRLEEKGLADIKRLPFSIKILVENLLRKLDGRIVREQDVLNIARWNKTYDTPVEIPYHPARVLMQDFTGVPAVVDLAVMRDAVADLGENPKKINPLVPVELIIDHSVQLDHYGTADALTKNVEKEYERNSERYSLLKWAQKSFDNFKVVPPNSGICHQVNLEHLGRVVISEEINGQATAYPDTLVGTDSHTTMINGIGVMGWGVGGIEAEAVMLGQPYYMSIPEVIGVRMVGTLKDGVTATDLVLKVTELLRNINVVEKFVEFFGPGMKSLSIPDRATIANMSPEYGATMGFFPVDEKTIEYLKLTHRINQAEIAEKCTKALGLFYIGDENTEYTQIIDLDISTVEPCVAGPSRPQDRIDLTDVKNRFAFNSKMVDVDLDESKEKIGDGSIVIAAITSCTNTSNPSVLIGAGLVAKKAVEKGIRVPAYVKTSLAPGSKVVIKYLEDSGLMSYLETLGFYLGGFGCTTCIGNSGPLHPEIENAISENDLNVAAVLSGNRNFEARIHQSIKSNFLASPMLVVAFAIAGRIDIDLTTEPLATDPNGDPVFLKDIWPGSGDIDNLVQKHVQKEFYETEYDKIYDGDTFWENLPVIESTTYDWNSQSTYIKKPPYFENFSLKPDKPSDVIAARSLLLLGDSVTTDHISPAGAIPKEYPAGQYLIEKSVPPEEFNTYGSRRGNHEVMMRGTFGNIRIKNQLVTPKEGSYTKKVPDDKEMFIYDAAMKYMDEGTPLVVISGKEYGTGSSRDWAAKGTHLLGIKAVIAKSYERIHRSNLVGMGVLPLMFMENDSKESLGLDGSESYFISGISDITPRKVVPVKAVRTDGSEIDFEVTTRLDTDVDVDYFENNGILPYVLRQILSQ
ncbi:aconitate hydratase AcnA [Thermodesulfobacteriota bacterium]